jgi:hypothetical protein
MGKSNISNISMSIQRRIAIPVPPHHPIMGATVENSAQGRDLCGIEPSAGNPREPRWSKDVLIVTLW